MGRLTSAVGEPMIRMPRKSELGQPEIQLRTKGSELGQYPPLKKNICKPVPFMFYARADAPTSRLASASRLPSPLMKARKIVRGLRLY